MTIVLLCPQLDALANETWLPSTKLEDGSLYIHYSTNYTYKQPNYRFESAIILCLV